MEKKVRILTVTDGAVRIAIVGLLFFFVLNLAAIPFLSSMGALAYLAMFGMLGISGLVFYLQNERFSDLSAGRPVNKTLQEQAVS